MQAELVVTILQHPVAFMGYSLLSSLLTVSVRKWTVVNRDSVRGVIGGRSSDGRLFGKSSAPRLHFDEKNVPKRSAFWQLAVTRTPLVSTIVGMVVLRSLPPACFSVDHHSRSDMLPREILSLGVARRIACPWRK